MIIKLIDKNNVDIEYYLNINKDVEDSNKYKIELRNLQTERIYGTIESTIKECIEQFIIYKNNEKLKFLKPVTTSTFENKQKHILEEFLKYEELFYK